jgi:hypothetical protein
MSHISIATIHYRYKITPLPRVADTYRVHISTNITVDMIIFNRKSKYQIQNIETSYLINIERC